MIAGFTEFAYGLDYLEYALRSILSSGCIDRYFIAYSPEPTRGNNPFVNPDKRDDVYAVAHDTCREFGIPLTWYENPGNWGRYDQRNSIFEKAPNAKLVVMTDADEIWQPGAPAHLIERALAGDTRFWRIPLRFFWRSFDWYCDYHPGKASWPVRAIRPDLPGAKGKPYTNVKDFDGVMLNEFGFARMPSDFAYKLPTHGHYRNGQVGDWFETVWLPWQPGQRAQHPYRNGFFGEGAKPFDKSELPAFMRQHPYYDMRVIGGHDMPMMRVKRGK